MTQQSKGYVQYNGLTQVYTFGSTWRPAPGPGYQVSVEKLCSQFGERAKDTSCGPTFIAWLMETLRSKPSFSLHLTQETYNEQAAISGGTTTVQSGLVSTADTQEQAASQLTSLRQQQASSPTQQTSEPVQLVQYIQATQPELPDAHGQQVLQQRQDERGGHVQTSEQPAPRTQRATQRLGTVRDILNAQKEGTPVMTGDMLEVQRRVDSQGGVASTFQVEIPVGENVPFQVAESRPDNSKLVQAKQKQVQVFMSNPDPSLGSPTKAVQGGKDPGVITNVKTFQDFSNIQPVDQTVPSMPAPGDSEANPMTGDDLAAASPYVGEVQPVAVPQVEARIAGGQTRPAAQGSPVRQEITLESIVKAPDVHRAIDSVNECTDRSLLILAKRQLDNDGSRASQRISSKIESRMSYLKQRGF